MTITTAPGLARFEDAPSVIAVLRSPSAPVREILAGLVTALALIPEVVLFARRVAHVIRAERTLSDDRLSVRYDVHGPMFFGSSNDLVEHFSYGADPKEVAIDLTYSQIWDASSVAAPDSIETRYRARGATVTFIGLDPRSAFHQRLSGQLGA